MIAALAALLSAADPGLEWFSLESANVHVHFHTGGERFARRVSAFAEEALSALGPVLDSAPYDTPVHIVCTDLVDGANGLAATLPYDQITLFAFAPEADTDLARADDWLRLLVFHELTHILHLDQLSGIWEGVNTALGKNLLPNHVLPQWFIEGLAVYAESRLAGERGGRVGSAAFEQYLRTAALEGTLPTSIGGFTSSPLTPPGGTWAYAFGGDFVTWLAARSGAASLAAFIQRYGRMLPLGLNTAAREAFGSDLPTLYREWRAGRVAAAQAFAASRPALTGARLTSSGHTHHAPVFARDGSLVVSETDGHGPERLVRYASATATEGLGPATVLGTCDGGCGHRVVLPEGRGLVMSSNDWADPHRFFRDLFQLPQAPSGRSLASSRRRLTRGLRAREPDVDAAGRRVAFVAARWGETALLTLDLTTQRLETLIPFERGAVLNQPRWVGEDVVVSAQRPGGLRDLWRVPGGAQEPRRLTSTREREVALATHAGRLVAAVDVDDVFDLWELAPDRGARRRLTRVHGGAMNPTVSPDGLTVVYQGWTAAGWDLYAVPLENAEPWETPASAEDTAPHTAGAPPSPARQGDPPPVLRPYNALRTLWPRSWAPTLRQTPNALLLNLVLFAKDPAERHLATLALDWNMTDQTLGAGLTYAFLGLRPRLTVSFARWPGVGLRYVADTLSEFHMENLFTSAAIDLALPDVVVPFDLGFDISAWWSFAPDRPSFAEGHDPGSDVPFQTEDDRSLSLRFRWSFNRVERYPYSISSELGVRAGMGFEVSPAPLGNRSTTWALTWSAEGYVPLGLPGFVGALSLQGGVRGGAAEHRGRFSVGGFPQQNLVQDVLNRAGLHGAFLRGFVPGALAGEVYVQSSTELRFPVVDLFRGPGTLPFAAERLFAAVWCDAALAYDAEPLPENVGASAGAELSLTAQLLYGLPTTFRLGWAAVVTAPFGGGPYFVMGAAF